MSFLEFQMFERKFDIIDHNEMHENRLDKVKKHVYENNFDSRKLYIKLGLQCCQHDELIVFL